MPLDELPIEVSMTDCRHCRISIPKGASVCHHCKKSQGWWQSKLESAAGFVSVVSIVVSIVLVALSWGQLLLSKEQFHEATEQRKSADRAHESAADANAQAKAAQREAVRARDEARNALQLVRTSVKLMLEKDAASPRLLLQSADTVKENRARQELEVFAVPDEKERQKWLESLKTKTK